MGAGFHGGFGKTSGAIMAFKIDKPGGLYKNYTKEILLDYINGVTHESSDIVELIKNGKIKLSVLGDELFNKYLGVGKNVVGVADANKIYIRSSAANIYSTLVHEGIHAMDSINRIDSASIKSSKGEFKAYLAEHNFQKAKGLKLDFNNETEIKVHIALNYKNGGKK